MVTLYGIKNCDTVRKARRWLKAHAVNYRFHDLREDGLSEALLDAWMTDLGWEQLLNRRGTTWRRLSPEERDSLTPERARTIMLAHPSIIKRPVLEFDTGRHLGFSEADYNRLFA